MSDHLTWGDLAVIVGAGYGKTISEEVADTILWNYTPFPMCTIEEVLDALDAYFEVSL